MAERQGKMIRVTVWNEFVHEREYEGIRAVYPDGIHGCIAEFLGRNEDIIVTAATLDMDNQGLSEELLRNTDVLIWWSHARQDDITDENVRLVARHVHSGMGLIALHSAHFSKIMKSLLGTTMTLKWRDNDREKLWCVSPAHPIAAGVPQCVDIPHEEMYGEFFDIPKPDDVVFMGWFGGGEVFRSGCTFTRGYGKIFYFQPGHEEFPIYHMPEIQKIITNAVRWAKPSVRLDSPPECECKN
ncbi:MAG: ThuA domain-containing protein [Oscillospiraceae bacterium]